VDANNERDPLESHYYTLLKATSKEFKGKSIEFRVDFPESFKNWYFIEIDIAFKIENCLFMIECKSTSVPRSREPNVIWWAKNFTQVIEKLSLKGQIIEYNIRNGILIDTFFANLEHFIPLEVNTEGLTGYSGLINTLNFIWFLGSLKNHVINGDFHIFLKENIHEFKDENDERKGGYFKLSDILYKMIFPLWKKIQEDPELKRIMENSSNSKI